MEALRIGMIGCGVHAIANIDSTLHYLGPPIAAVAARHLDRAQVAAERFGAPHAYDNYHHMLAKEKLDAIFAGYGLKKEVQDLYPFELSGGMNRRVLVSTAMMGNPRLVIADEPTPGLHMKMVRRVMEHFRELADRGAGVLLITHDLEQALEVADRVVVFYAGTTIEDADVKDFAKEETLRHPYTKALWRALPQNGFQFIPGTQPYVKEMPEGCPFRPRCGQCTEACRGDIPWREIRGGKARCIYAE